MSTDPARGIFEELATWTPEDFERHNRACTERTERLQASPLGRELLEVQRQFNAHSALPVEKPSP